MCCFELNVNVFFVSLPDVTDPELYCAIGGGGKPFTNGDATVEVEKLKMLPQDTKGVLATNEFKLELAIS
jgi:alpha-D-ribose 1-methylphosphonate 5-triphosphate synthase subunit PhnG